MIVLSFDEYSKLLANAKALEAFTKTGYFRVMPGVKGANKRSVRFAKYQPT